MLVNPEEDETEDFDQMIAAANEEGSGDEAFGTGERIGDTDSNFIMERFGLGNGAEFVGHRFDIYYKMFLNFIYYSHNKFNMSYQLK